MCDCAEFVSGLARVHTGFQPAEHGKIVRRTPLWGPYAHQRPDVYRFILREPDAGSHDAGDNVRATIELDRASNDLRVTVQLSLPELVTDYYDGWRFGAVVLRLKGTVEKLSGIEFRWCSRRDCD